MAVDHGPHCLALLDDAIAHFRAEVEEKVTSGQAKPVMWDSIKDNPLVELEKIANCGDTSQVETILLYPGSFVSLMIETGNYCTVGQCNYYQTAPKGAIDQLGHSLT